MMFSNSTVPGQVEVKEMSSHSQRSPDQISSETVSHGRMVEVARRLTNAMPNNLVRDIQWIRDVGSVRQSHQALLRSGTHSLDGGAARRVSPD
jgi:hypothetical protein